MDFNSIVGGVLSNAIWWILGLLAIGFFVLFKRTGAFWRAIPLAKRLHKEGLERLLFSRHEYPERLDAYLDRAEHSIKIVSISLRITDRECALTELFRRKLASSSSFEIHVSLLEPNTGAATLAARALNVEPDVLSKEIDDMLGDLKTLRSTLPPMQQGRFHLYVHDCFPMGSAIMLDAAPTSGLIQVETKLYRAPRSESFSFEVVAPSTFYSRNFSAWNTVIDESKLV